MGNIQTVRSGGVLKDFQALRSPNGKWDVCMQQSGILTVVYIKNKLQPFVTWETKPIQDAKPPFETKLDKDGNIVMYDEKNTIL